MFVNGFNKTASMFGSIKGLLSAAKPKTLGSAVSTATKSMQPKTLAKRLDGSKVTTEWGLQQGKNSGSIRYGDIL